jgi:CubicO group peptidase (beta-lactamase class C family)
MTFDRARAVLRAAVDARAFPAASVEVGTADGVLWREAFGRLTFAPDAQAAREDTVFDLASLTKVLSTTALVMRHVEQHRVELDEPVSTFLASWRGMDRETVTIRDLLAHCSGLTAYLPFFRDHRGRVEYEHAISTLPLEYEPRTKSIYSDLGFILLAFILEDRAGGIPLDAQFDALRDDIDRNLEVRFRPGAEWIARTAPTEEDRWRGRLLVGDVHDENAWALGGAAGHAGLFGTAAAVGAFAAQHLRILRGDPGVFERATVETFISRRREIPGSSRALGWDTMLTTSSCGTCLSPRAFGHTGFTGTSLWIDPDRGLYAALLTNRVHPTRDNDAVKGVRPAWHDAVIQDLGR